MNSKMAIVSERRRVGAATDDSIYDSSKKREAIYSEGKRICDCLVMRAWGKAERRL